MNLKQLKNRISDSNDNNFVFVVWRDINPDAGFDLLCYSSLKRRMDKVFRLNKALEQSELNVWTLQLTKNDRTFDENSPIIAQSSNSDEVLDEIVSSREGGKWVLRCKKATDTAMEEIGKMFGFDENEEEKIIVSYKEIR